MSFVEALFTKVHYYLLASSMVLWWSLKGLQAIVFENLQYFAVAAGVVILFCLVGFSARALTIRYPVIIGYTLQYTAIAWGLWIGIKIMGF